MKFSDGVTINRSFESSVNVAYDFGDDSKLNAFIPTISSCDLIEKLTSPAVESNSQRAKILIGPYGKGKSHVVLVALSLLCRRESDAIRGLISRIELVNARLADYLYGYQRSGRRLLPVIITGNTSSLAQSFLIALDEAVTSIGAPEAMPRTNFRQALESIETWRASYPDTYERFSELTGSAPMEFMERLRRFDRKAYDEFLEMYPSLTSGSEFNTFAGMNPVDAYTEVASRIGALGYSGLYIVYDEFGKYLEANIAEARDNDTRLLQDLAERCARSSQNAQMHMLLICHKDISNYIDSKLQQTRVDGWRGVSGRYEHLEMSSEYSESYRLIDAVIGITPKLKKELDGPYRTQITVMRRRYKNQGLFDRSDMKTVLEGCYPLHPVTTYLLPRISEKVAQNERTLFTFLAANERYGFEEATKKLSFGDTVPFVAPSDLYDYFEPLFRKEPPNSPIRAVNESVARALEDVPDEKVAAVAIVKMLGLLYIAQCFSVLPPNEKTISSVLSDFYSPDQMHDAMKTLTVDHPVVRIRRSDEYLQIRANPEIDLEEAVSDEAAKIASKKSVVRLLNELISGRAIYPSRHNNFYEIVRYFSCKFVSADNIEPLLSGEVPYPDRSDGWVIGVVPTRERDNDWIMRAIKSSANAFKGKPECRTILCVSLLGSDVEEDLYRYAAVGSLMQDESFDSVTLDELASLQEDFGKVVREYVDSFFSPEKREAKYFHAGLSFPAQRRSALSDKLSEMCDAAFPHTPRINNEAINKNEPTGTAISARNRILSALCNPTVQPNLGLLGNAQETSIMRSIYTVTGVYEDMATAPKFNEHPNRNDDGTLEAVLVAIDEFAKGATEGDCVSDLYDLLCGGTLGIGMKRGPVILYLAAYLREHKRDITIYRGDEEASLSVDTLIAMDEVPEQYRISYSPWVEAYQGYVTGLATLFEDFYNPSEADPEGFEYVVDAIGRWYLRLPRISKTVNKTYLGNGRSSALPTEIVAFRRVMADGTIGPKERLFDRIPSCLGVTPSDPASVKAMAELKETLDGIMDSTMRAVEEDVRQICGAPHGDRRSTAEIMRDWITSADERIAGRVLGDESEGFLCAVRTECTAGRFSIKRICRAVTSLKIEDWDDKTITRFVDQVREAVASVNKAEESAITADHYTLSFLSEDGETLRTFEKTELSPRAKLLRSTLSSAVDEMGQSITLSEKRQALIEVLEEML